MVVYTRRIRLEMEAETGIVDITDEVMEAVAGSGAKNGVVTVFMVGSTGGVSTMEYEPNLARDINRALEVFARGTQYTNTTRHGGMAMAEAMSVRRLSDAACRFLSQTEDLSWADGSRSSQ